MDYPDLSIMIPMYNESASAGAVVQSARDAYPGAEIVVCDDGSNDNTLEVLAALADDIDFRLVRHEINSGYGSAWKTLASSASREFGVFFDGDGPFDVADIGRVYEDLRTTGATMVSGERSANMGSPLRRRPGKLVLRMFTRLMSGRAVRDFNCGLRAVRIEQLRKYLPLLPDGFSASTTSLLSYLGSDQRVHFISIDVAERESGKSSVSIVRDGFRTLALIAKVTMLFGPLRVFTPLAVTLFLIGLLYGVYEALQEGIGFPVLASLTIVNGVVIGSVGLLADQIAHLRRSTLGLE
jgi:glycosyltransferase involved in cell wall biosynthesis